MSPSPADETPTDESPEADPYAEDDRVRSITLTASASRPITLTVRD